MTGTSTVATDDGVSLRYRVAGSGTPVILVGDLGLGPWQWGWQHAALAAGPYEVVTFATRGTDGSGRPPADCTLDRLAGDAAAVCDAAGTRRPHVVGAGLGGLVALALARDGRVDPRSLVLLGTAASGDGVDPEPLFAPPDDRAALRERLGAVCSDSFVSSHPDAIDRIVDWRAREDADREAWERQAAALDGRVDDCHRITCPALVVHGADDDLWPVDGGRALADDLPRGAFRAIPDAGHLAWVEAARPVNDALVAFLDDLR